MFDMSWASERTQHICFFKSPLGPVAGAEDGRSSLVHHMDFALLLSKAKWLIKLYEYGLVWNLSSLLYVMTERETPRRQWLIFAIFMVPLSSIYSLNVFYHDIWLTKGWITK